MPLDDAIIRPATADDIPNICDFLLPFTAKKEILARTPEDLRERIGNFFIAEKDGRLVGTVALREFNDGLQEVRTLTVAPELHGQGLGTRLVMAVIELAKQRKATQICTLTMRPNLFLRLGFAVVDIGSFPQKVQNDCMACPKRHQCDETALLLRPSQL